MQVFHPEDEFHEDDVASIGDDAASLDLHHDPARVTAVVNAVKAWVRQLIDVGGRNNLLFFRELKVGTLSLDGVPEEALNGLLADKTVSLRRLFPDLEDRADAAKRIRTLRKKATENYEERGIQTLRLACGFSSWEDPKRPTKPYSPILLVPFEVEAKGSMNEDFDLHAAGDWEVNPALIHVLNHEFGCDLDAEELMSFADDADVFSLPEFFRFVETEVAGVPGFEVNDSYQIGNFSYSKLPMVTDIQSSLAELIDHDLIAAIAGDPNAREGLASRIAEVSLTDPNFVPPSDEYLVLDADSSQNYAINSVIAGQDLVIDGPPGSGKSQTISNLIASLIARGKHVLFVAEKRAAIDAVLKRLDSAGLSNLILDVHDGATSRRKVAQALSAALKEIGGVVTPDVQTLHARLASLREQVNTYPAALHEVREPWGISLFESQSTVMGTSPLAQTSVRLRGNDLLSLTPDKLRLARESLREFAALGGITLSASSSPWASSVVTTSDDAGRALKFVQTIQHQTLPKSNRLLESILSDTGLKKPRSVDEWASLLELLHGVKESLAVFSPDLFADDLERIESQFERAGRGMFSRFAAFASSSSYRKARSHLRARCIGSKPSAKHLYIKLKEARDQVRRWQEKSQGSGTPRVPSALAEAAGAFDQLNRELRALGAFVSLESSAVLGPDELGVRVEQLNKDQAILFKLPRLFELEQTMLGLGLGELLAEVKRLGLPEPLAVPMLNHSISSSIVDHLSLSDSRVGSFDGNYHDQVIDEYKATDKDHISANALRVRRLAAEMAVMVRDEHKEQSARIEREAAKKTRHIPLRQLFSEAPDVLTSVKPCWVMSPLVVSQILPPHQYFDVVIFDEASQIPPAEAIPAILRGRQVVVAGDQRQLPPTTFFASTVESDQEEEDPASLALTDNIESILDVLKAMLRARTLEWHYRSRDERLIAFSNAWIYDSMLTTFPGVSIDGCVSHVLVPFEVGKAGTTGSPDAEVEEVVRLVLEHAEARPDESLGVITMGIKHADRIEETLRRARGQRPDLDEFFDEAVDERFFVKNLERVQGDERDAVILSIGYGKQGDGRLRYFFGPLNTTGGERRLNVAVTRAKRRMTLVSSFSSADMDPERETSEGVRLLRLFLQFAESAGSNLGEAQVQNPELNPFEISVRDALTAAGIPLVAQYGCSGYRMDFAASHPKQPGKLVLAIECDGAMYHSTPTARDRDRLRQEHLERLGWSFHRIWSTDWFRYREREIEKARASYQKAVALADKGGASGLDRKSVMSTDAAPASQPRIQKPRFTKGWQISDYPDQQLDEVARWIRSDGLLRTKEELLAEMMLELGFRRRGNEIVRRIMEAIQRTARE